MPAEFAPHQATLMAWPARVDLWGATRDRDTDGHVDGVAQFVRSGVVMLSVAAGDSDPNAPRFDEEEAPEGVLDARGRRFDVMDGPANAWVDLEGVGQTVIPYVNHYLADGGVIVPEGDIPGDAVALDLLSKAYPGREVVGVLGGMISFGGGGPRFITQQVPAGSFVG